MPGEVPGIFHLPVNDLTCWCFYYTDVIVNSKALQKLDALFVSEVSIRL